MAYTGKFVTFEGTEGSGKSTQAQIVAERLRKAGRDVLLTREPGGTRMGESVRGILTRDSGGEALCPEAELMLFAASRAQLVRAVVRPALERGTIVIADRFCDSTTAYQGEARGMDATAIEFLNRLACAGIVPDLTILLDVEVHVGLHRLSGRLAEGGQKSDRIERESRSFHERVRAGYVKLVEQCPERIKLVDGSRDVESVAEEIWGILQDVVGTHAG